MRISVFILSVFTILIFAAGCDLVNPAEKTPTYVRIDSFQFVPTTGTGTQSHKITAVFAYLDATPLGAFDLPAKIPVLADKKGLLLVRPAVVYSGLNDVLVPYPYYEKDTATFNPAPGATVSFTPKTKYTGDSTMNILNVDFESGNSFVSLQGDTMRKTNDPKYVFEGSYGGVIELNNSDYSESVMSEYFTAVSSGAFLELNYKGTLPFQIGVIGSDGTQDVTSYLFGFNPKSEWNKVYIGLQDFINTYPNKQYRILVKVTQNAPTTGYVAFDNFKVITQ
jgi:hypothetical protein